MIEEVAMCVILKVHKIHKELQKVGKGLSGVGVPERVCVKHRGQVSCLDRSVQ